MSDTIQTIQQARPVTQTRNRVRKTIDYANTAQLSSYSGNRGELIYNTDNSQISYVNGSGPVRFAVASIISANTASLPVASAANRGHIYTVANGTANDSVVVCAYTGTTSNTFTWVTIS